MWKWRIVCRPRECDNARDTLLVSTPVVTYCTVVCRHTAAQYSTVQYTVYSTVRGDDMIDVCVVDSGTELTCVSYTPSPARRLTAKCFTATCIVHPS